MLFDSNPSFDSVCGWNISEVDRQYADFKCIDILLKFY